MTSPSPHQIKDLARDYGYVERREEASRTLFFEKSNDGKYPTLINIFYTTRGVMTKVAHPKRGYNQLWRSDAYDSLESLAELFENPRIHTGTGYRTADQSVRGCVQCGRQQKRHEFSKNQWRKGAGGSKCQECITAGAGSTQQDAVEHVGEAVGALPLQIDRAYITCDADGCSTVAPRIRCNCCWMTYYCSQSCQNRHRQEHAPDCISIDEMRHRFASYTEPNASNMRNYAMVTQLSGKRTFDALLDQAEYIFQADKDWERAIELYKELMMRDQTAGTAPQWRRVWMGFSRCFYELGVYDKAVHAGSAAIEMNRHFPQIHKYVALAQKASGDYEAGKATMTRAVLYEAPWEEKNLELNLKQLADF